MFCDKTGVNQLTALLASHGFRDIVVCPGSRNGALVHNFHQCREIFTLHSVTDERSAAFIAIGIYLSERKPVALCVTSGSALLNTLPGVAEAYFRHVPLLVISADRPAERIGQLDGQTLFQPDALKPYAASYNLPETDRPQDCRLRNRLINEAILSMQHNGKQPVHINVPLTEPLFTFSTTGLPAERIVCEIRPTVAAAPLPEDLTARIARAHFPVLLIGQYEEDLSAPLRQFEENASLLVLPELIGNSSYSWRTNMLEEIISGMEGVGKVQVMITLSDTGMEILERNREITASDLEETDNARGNRKNTESGEREEVIYKKDADGNETPYVVQRKLPEVTGVVVIAEGAGNTKVKENIIGAVSVLFNLNEHRIKVIRMKS